MDTGTTRAPTAPANIKFRGVRKRSSRRYRAQITVDKERRVVGYFVTAEEAARAYDRAAQENFGDAAILNYIDGTLNVSRVNTNRVKGKKTSKFRGVYFRKTQRKYRASVCVGGRKVCIGEFKNEEDAGKAYDRLAKKMLPTSCILNFLPDGSLNPDRLAHWRRGREAPASAADNTEKREGDEEEDDDDDEEEEEDEDGGEEEEEEEEEDEDEEDEEGRPRKLRRLNEGHFIDLTDDEPPQVVIAASSASRASTRIAARASVRAMSSGGSGRASGKSAAFNGRRAMPSTDGGGAEGPTQPLHLPTATHAAATSLAASSVKAEAVPAVVPAPAPLKVEASAAVPVPAPLSTPRVKVEAPAAVPPSSSSSSGLKMTLLQAVSILGAEAFKRLATCEDGSEQASSLERLMNLLQQLLREARSAHASSSASSALPGSSTADLQTFLLTFVCPKYTAEELKGSQLDNVIQMGLCAIKL